MNRILIVGRANTISQQLAALWPLGRVPHYRNINSNGEAKSRQHTAPSASYQAAGIPQPAADHGERT